MTSYKTSWGNLGHIYKYGGACYTQTETLIVKSKFKGETVETQRDGFNIRYEKFINFCEKKFEFAAFIWYNIRTYKRGYTCLI